MLNENLEPTEYLIMYHDHQIVKEFLMPTYDKLIFQMIQIILHLKCEILSSLAYCGPLVAKLLTLFVYT